MTLHLAAALSAASVWNIRFKYDHVGARKDLTWVLFFWIFLTRWSNAHSPLKLFLAVIWLCDFFYLKRQRQDQHDEVAETGSRMLEKETHNSMHRSRFETDDSRALMQPFIFPCGTSHTRLFPKKHSFSYSYLFVAIPVGWRGHVNNILSADIKSLPQNRGRPKNGWFNVDSADYLARGEHLDGLQGKLDEYLKTQVGRLIAMIQSGAHHLIE